MPLTDPVTLIPELLDDVNTGDEEAVMGRRLPTTELDAAAGARYENGKLGDSIGFKKGEDLVRRVQKTEAKGAVSCLFIPLDMNQSLSPTGTRCAFSTASICLDTRHVMSRDKAAAVPARATVDFSTVAASPRAPRRPRQSRRGGSASDGTRG